MKRISLILGFLTLTFPSVAFCQDGYSGLCQGRVDSTLSFPVGGVIAQILKKESDPVRENEVILELESTTESLEVARQTLAVEAAKKDYDRTRKARAAGGSITQEEVDQKEAIWQVAQVEKQQAEALLERRRLKAPADGMVVDLFDFERGEAVAANTPVARVLDATQCRFTAHVKGDSLHGFEKGKEVELTFVTEKGPVTVKGTVEFVSPVIDAASGLKKIRAVFDNMEGRISSGQAGKMKLKNAK